MAAHIYTALRELESDDCTVAQFRNAQSYAQLGDNLEGDHWTELYAVEDDVLYKAIALGYVPFYCALWRQLDAPRTAEQWSAARWGDDHEAVAQWIKDYNNPPPPPPEPTTGVYSVHDIDWDFVPGFGIDPDYEASQPTADDAGVQDDYDFFPDEIESERLLYGDWIVYNGEYMVDGEHKLGFSFIENVDRATVQVIWSEHVRYGKAASPCYPGQVDAEVDDPLVPDGEPQVVTERDQWYCMAPETCCVAYYALPPQMLRKDGE